MGVTRRSMTQPLVQHPLICTWLAYVPDDYPGMSPTKYTSGPKAAGRAQARIVTALWAGCLALWIVALGMLVIELSNGQAPLVAMCLGAASFVLAFAGAGIGSVSATTILRRPAFVPMVQRRITFAQTPVIAGALARMSAAPARSSLDLAHVRHRRPARTSHSGSAFPRGRTACIGRVDASSVRRRRRGR